MSFVLLGILNSQALAGGGINFPYYFSILSQPGDDILGLGSTTDSANNILIAGEFTSGEGLAQKYSSGGQLLWQKSLSTIGESNEANDIAVDSSDNVYLLVEDFPSDKYPNLTKLNSSGVVQFQRSVITDVNSANAIAVDNSNNCYLSYRPDTINDFEIGITKLDSSGNRLDETLITMDRTARDEFMTTDSAGNIYLLTAQAGAGFAEEDLILFKLNSSLTIQWQRLIGDAAFQRAQGIAVDSADNVYITAEDSSSAGAFEFNLLTAKFNSSGTLQWQRNLSSGASGRIDVEGIACDSNNNVYVVGNTSNFATGGNNSIVAKYNSSGTIQWQRFIETDIDDRLRSVSVDSNDDVILNGQFRGWFDPADDVAFLGKIPNDGSLTGTYTLDAKNVIYGTSSFTDLAGDNTVSTTSFGQSTPTNTVSASSMTESSTTAEQYIVEVG